MCQRRKSNPDNASDCTVETDIDRDPKRDSECPSEDEGLSAFKIVSRVDVA